MFYVTLTYNGLEKSAADWNLTDLMREVKNQWSDRLSANQVAAFDGPDPFPYDAYIVLRIGRVPGVGPSALPNGDPISGSTAWADGAPWAKIIFAGYRTETFREGNPAMEAMQFKFVGPWERFLDRTVFKKLYLTWSQHLAKQIADYTAEYVLGQSATFLTGDGDTVPGTIATNYMSIRQQVAEAAQYALTCATNEQAADTPPGWPGGAQFQFDNLTHDNLGNYFLLTALGPNNRIIDYIPGFAGANGATSANTAGLPLRAPLKSVNNLSCAEAIRDQLAYLGGTGGPIGWFDYTQTPPALIISTKDHLPTATLPLPALANGAPAQDWLYAPSDATKQRPYKIRSVKIKKRDDLLAPAVHLTYLVNGSVNNVPFSQTLHDITANIPGLGVITGYGEWGDLTTLGGVLIDTAYGAGTQAKLQAASRRSDCVSQTANYQGLQISCLSAAITTQAAGNLANDPSSSQAALLLWEQIFPDLPNVQNLQFYNSGNQLPDITDPSGAPLNLAATLAAFPYWLTDGDIAPWMPGNQSGGAVQKIVLTAYLSYTDVLTTTGDPITSTTSTPYHPRTREMTLTSLPTGTYQSVPAGIVSEQVPRGCSLYLYTLLNIPQFEGTIEIIENEVTDQVPIGSVLNCPGTANAEWAAMAACLQSVSYNFDRASTLLSFGPPKHLGFGDLVELLKWMRGPRYAFGRDPLNTGSSGPPSLGSNSVKQATGAGVKIDNFKLFPNSVADLATNAAANGQSQYQIPPGAMIYGAGGQPLTFQQAPVFSQIPPGPGIALVNKVPNTVFTDKFTIDLTVLRNLAVGAGFGAGALVGGPVIMLYQDGMGNCGKHMIVLGIPLD